MKIIYGIFLLFLLAACSRPKADLLIVNGTIYTVDSAFSKTEALVIKDGKILETGTSKALQEKYEAAETIDAAGKFIYPGLIDAHCHFLGYGKSLNECNLVSTSSWEDILHRVSDFRKGMDTTQWLIGRGWDQNDWEDKHFPTNALLNARYPNQPVLLTRIDGHAAIANQKALDLAGIKPGQSIAGGDILVKNGILTGLLVDNAVDLLDNVIPATTDAQRTDFLTDAAAQCFAVGLTGVHDCGLDAGDVELVKQLHASGKLQMRMYIMLSDKEKNYAYAFANGKIKTDKLTVCGFKLYADGALGSRGACLLHPYSDQANWSGFLLKPIAYFDSILPVIAAKGWQACTHAIGDSANRTILKLYNKTLAGNANARWRIEHAQVINEKDFNMFGSGIVPSVQPTHATSDMYWAGDRLGSDRVKGAYAYKQLLDQNGWLPLGTDFPVEDISPFKTFYAAVVRKDAKGWPDSGYQKLNALSREQALRGMTIWAAKAAFEEGEKGSLEAGKYADLIILDKDLMQAPEKELLQIKVLQTFIGGKKVFGK